jgi:hypothetical protein
VALQNDHAKLKIMSRKLIVILVSFVFVCLIIAGHFIPIKKTKGMEGILAQFCSPSLAQLQYGNYRVIFNGTSRFNKDEKSLAPYSPDVAPCAEQAVELRLYLW